MGTRQGVVGVELVTKWLMLLLLLRVHDSHRAALHFVHCVAWRCTMEWMLLQRLMRAFLVLDIRKVLHGIS